MTTLPPQIAPLLVTAALVQIVIALALHFWARSVGRPRAWRWIPRLPLLGVALILCGLGGTLVGIEHAFVAVENVVPSDKAALLAMGISHAMWSTALLAIPGMLLYAVTGIICLVATFQPVNTGEASPSESTGGSPC